MISDSNPYGVISLEEVIKTEILYAVDNCPTVKLAAKLLGISKQCLKKRLRKYGDTRDRRVQIRPGSGKA